MRKTMKREDFIYSTEHTSPDGVWLVEYGYVDGERSPQFIEPRVTELATGRVFIDFWRSCLDGSILFTPNGFQLTVRDPYGPTTVSVSIDSKAETFVVAGEASTRRPLRELNEVVGNIVVRARQELQSKLARPEPISSLPLWTRLRRWFNS